MNRTRMFAVPLLAASLIAAAACASRDDDDAASATSAAEAATDDTEAPDPADDASDDASEAAEDNQSEGPDDSHGAADTTAVPDEEEPAEATEEVEVGVTADEIRIGVIADVDTQLAPGLSLPIWSAMEAWADSVNESGGLAGRRVVLTQYDSRLNPDEAANAVTDACQREFALVGSGMFNLLNPAPLLSCADMNGDATGLPDVAALAIAPGAAMSPVTFAIVLAGQDFSTEPPDWVVSQFGYEYMAQLAGSDSPAILHVNPGVPGTAEEADAAQRAAEERGWTAAGNITYPDAATQSEALPIVNQIDAGVNVVASTSIGVAKIMAEAAIQGVDMDSVVWACTSQCQTPAFVATNGETVEGLLVSQVVLPYGETENEAIADYRDRVPDENVSANGLIAFAAGKAFEELMATLVDDQGINGVTRANLLALLESGPAVNAAGILAEGTVLGERNQCWVTNQIIDGNYVRVDPPDIGEFNCDPDAVVRLPG